MQWGLEPSVRNVPNEKKIFQRLTRTECVCVCGLQIPSFNVVQFLWTDSTAECGSGPENGSSRRRMPGGTPFLSDFFLKSEPYVHRPARKVVRQKKRTNTEQGKSGRSRARPGPGFGQLNVRYQSQNLSKAVPKMSSRFLLRSQLMGTSGSFGRWHSPQVAPAAPPAPRVHSSIILKLKQFSLP